MWEAFRMEWGLAPQGIHTPQVRTFPFTNVLVSDEQANVCLSTMSLDDPRDFLHLKYAIDSTNKLQHLGQAYFLFVSSSQALINYDFYTPYPYTHNVFLSIFKEIEADAMISSISRIMSPRRYMTV